MIPSMHRISVWPDTHIPNMSEQTGSKEAAGVKYKADIRV